MIKKIFLLLLVLWLGGCSLSTPKNKWQLNSISAYENYKNYFLQNKENLANVELKRAKSCAKESADLQTLARIELSVCALHVSVLKQQKCEAYDALEPIVNSKELAAYSMLLQNKLQRSMIENLPKKYQDFAHYLLNNDYTKAQNSLNEIDDIVSKMVAASLIRNTLSSKTVKNIIDESSAYGYKKAVIAWLKFYIKMDIDKNEKEKALKILNVIDNSK